MWSKFLKKIVRFLDPKLDKYRDCSSNLDTIKSSVSSSESSRSQKSAPAPKTFEEFIELLRRTPKSILSDQDRDRLAAVMSFDDRYVSDLMTPREKMIFVNKKEILGPLILDKLYKSGFTYFPVVDEKNKVLGVIHTEALNALEIRKTDRAEKYLDSNFSYLHASDSLSSAVEKIKKTNTYFFLVLAKDDSLAGFFTIEMLLDYFLE